MAFAGTFGAAGALIPATLISNIKGEIGVSYDADGRIRFQTSSGQIYTPERVDTLFISAASDQGAGPLGALQVGAASIANVDTGQLVTAAPVANQNGLPTNFGPGRGKWNGPTGQFRLAVTAAETITVVSVTLAGGSVVCASGPSGNDAAATCRNFHGEALGTLSLKVECIHSIQG